MIRRGIAKRLSRPVARRIRRTIAPRVAWGVLLAAFSLAACSEDEDSSSGPTPPIPEPEYVAPSDVVKESENVYYREWCGSGDLIPQAEAILDELLDADLEIFRAWFPMECSPCDCAMCATAIVLELYAPDARVEDLGFLPDHTWVLNCGVSSMARYTFPENSDDPY
jgi:hypothetical protein